MTRDFLFYRQLIDANVKTWGMLFLLGRLWTNQIQLGLNFGALGRLCTQIYG
jgi:hypothetical protein